MKFLMHRWANQVNRLTGLRPNPRLNVNYYVDSSQESVYTSWQTSLRKRYSRNLSGTIHYTWGKGLSTSGGDIGAYYQGDAGNGNLTQGFFNPRADRGPNTGDLTNYFISERLYVLPRLQALGSGLARHALGEWQVAGVFFAHTGEAVTLTQPSTLPGSRPDYIGGSPILDNSRLTLQYLNRGAFARVGVNSVSNATVRPGNVGNGAIRVPGAWSVDISLAKHFSITEEIKFSAPDRHVQRLQSLEPEWPSDQHHRPALWPVARHPRGESHPDERTAELVEM